MSIELIQLQKFLDETILSSVIIDLRLWDKYIQILKFVDIEMCRDRGYVYIYPSGPFHAIKLYWTTDPEKLSFKPTWVQYEDASQFF